LADTLVVFATLRVISAGQRDARLDTKHNPCPVGIWFYSQKNSLVLFFGEPTSLEQGNSRTTMSASDRPRPKVRNGRLGYPSRPPLVIELLEWQIVVKGLNVGTGILAQRDLLYRLAVVRMLLSPGLNLFQRLPIRVRGVAHGQFLPRFTQDPPTPGAYVPGEISLERMKFDRKVNGSTGLRVRQILLPLLFVSLVKT
jgi:hypothetical protein